MGSDSDKKLIDQLFSGTGPSEPYGKKPSNWSHVKKHKDVAVSKDKTVAFFRRHDDSFKQAAIFANHPVPAGIPKFYYEVKIGTIDKTDDSV
ncbi:hypothetical protein Daus18300_012108 [Diaporthe australafricana]|uniref:Uncharacterized protein n=1 Tax=Diaporthe australafricana TaxID=127596 RepID=A0ABR3W4A2_9PEZI